MEHWLLNVWPIKLACMLFILWAGMWAVAGALWAFVTVGERVCAYFRVGEK